ncbi:MAG: aspartate ammonia-lyase [Acidimicrobiia bacterium]
MKKGEFRIERDSMGEMEVPKDALYGAQTQRAYLNFPISSYKMPSSIIRALGLIKWAAAESNKELGTLDPVIADAIASAALEVAEGKHLDHFPLDVFQTGSGTSTNMNANEVIARLAELALGGSAKVHPNDHVNLGQSSNDVFPSAVHIAVAEEITKKLMPALEVLQNSLAAKEGEFNSVIKTGRTHLMDATPIRLGQEFGGYRRQVEAGVERIKCAMERLLELPLGGTAVGTGINMHPDFPRKAITRISHATGLEFKEAQNHFEAQGARDGLVELSGALKTIAVSGYKIANDIRWMNSGPMAGIAEITVPAVQPGSSIMPGKVNPVYSEVVMQVACQIIGNDSTISVAGLSGNFELNVMIPVMGWNALESVALLSSSLRVFAERCIDGIKANVEKCRRGAESSLSIVTALVPLAGYDACAEIAKEAALSGKTIREVAIERGLPEEAVDRALDLEAMTRPGL